MPRSFLMVGILFLIAACKKDEQRMGQVKFSGTVIDSSAKTGIPNVTVKMLWVHSTTLKETPADSSITDALGNYSLNSNIDLSRFDNEFLNIVAVIPDSYVDAIDLGNSTQGWSVHGVQGDELKNLSIYLFPKALLAITLKRTMNDSFDEFLLSYDYGNRSYWPEVNTYPSAQTYNVVTAAGIKTKIHWIKKTFSGSTTDAQDSITCVANAPNQITMNF